MDLTVEGKKMMSNFLLGICGLPGSFTMADRQSTCIEYIRRTVGSKKVLMLLSGGVDSTVCAALMNKALRPDQVVAIHIDNGFMRKDESDQVGESLGRIGLNVRVERAGNEFMNGDTTVKVETEKGIMTSKKTGEALSCPYALVQTLNQQNFTPFQIYFASSPTPKRSDA